MLGWCLGTKVVSNWKVPYQSSSARTLESSQYLLKGMYPSEKRNPDLVLEYHIADQDSEWLFPSTACRRLEDLSAQFTKRMRKVLRSDIEYLGRKFANYLPNPDRRPTTYDLHDLYDQNAILQANNGTLLPKFTMEDFRLVDKVVTGLWFTVRPIFILVYLDFIYPDALSPTFSNYLRPSKNPRK